MRPEMLVSYIRFNEAEAVMLRRLDDEIDVYNWDTMLQ